MRQVDSDREKPRWWELGWHWGYWWQQAKVEETEWMIAIDTQEEVIRQRRWQIRMMNPVEVTQMVQGRRSGYLRKSQGPGEVMRSRGMEKVGLSMRMNLGDSAEN
jgi:hypothetical protein